MQTVYRVKIRRCLCIIPMIDLQKKAHELINSLLIKCHINIQNKNKIIHVGNYIDII